MHKLLSFQLLFFICFFSALQLVEASELAPLAKSKKIVLIAGSKSHGPKVHEYIKSVRLIKTMLDNSNVEGITTEIHFSIR